MKNSLKEVLAMQRKCFLQHSMSLTIIIFLMSMFMAVSGAEDPSMFISKKPFSLAHRELRRNDADQWIDPVTGITFVRIPAGCFEMGQTEGERQWLLSVYGEEIYRSWFANELPRHEVCIGEFWMGTTEVTNAQFRRWNSYHDSGTVEGYSLNEDEQPSVNISWAEAKEFAAWLSNQHKSHFTFRLPTEAEWEYAAQGGTFSSLFWGDNRSDACQYANVADQTAQQKWPDWPIYECTDGHIVSAPVGTFLPNPFHLYDMIGNVSEWCEDVYDNGAYSRHKRDNPVIASNRSTLSDSGRLIRGGNWVVDAKRARSAYRDEYLPVAKVLFIGFRLVRTRNRLNDVFCYVPDVRRDWEALERADIQ